MGFRAALVLATLLLTCVAPPAARAQASAPPADPGTASTTWTLRNWSRVEWWRFFEPPPGGGDHEYAYPVNRLQAGVRRDGARYGLTAALQYVQFGNLPADAVGPGPLGLGAVYFGHAGRSDSRQVYLRYLHLQLKDLLPGVTLQVGRMPYASGGEDASGHPKIEAVTLQRVAARLVGEFEWSIYQRGYDGVRVDVVRRPWRASAVAFSPTQGGFEDAAGLMMPDVRVLGGTFTVRPVALGDVAEVQAFALRYSDDREVAARPDNTGRAAAGVDVGINTFGATLVAASSAVEGRQWDGLLWLAGQTGSWYEQTHRAFSIAAEAGHQWGAARWRPWLRGGVLWASGDDDPTDDRHGTFFQMLPTVRRYAQTALYSQMNSVDVFVQAFARPTPSLAVRADVHRVGLADARDRWYFGSGATQSRGSQLGFSTRPSSGRTDLATIVELSGDYTLSRRWSINAFLGVARGGEVVRRSFAGRTMTFGYLENVLQF
ncbi:MAG: alginate export family protein [Acidobacteria bacterium]|nr:alginate export family protein [Acidobacteriota bacterium]